MAAWYYHGDGLKVWEETFAPTTASAAFLVIFAPTTLIAELSSKLAGVSVTSRSRTVPLPIDPIMFHKVRTGPGWMVVRYNGDPRVVKAAIEREWKQVTNEVPFNAKFSEDVMAEAYEKEDARAEIFAGFALLAVIIGCLGLFGLAAFTAERRTKEIGIRKVLGARTRDIVRLLVWQFSRPVIVANLIAWPAAWWLMRDWLNKFDDRIDLGPTPFITAALVALTIAIVDRLAELDARQAQIVELHFFGGAAKLVFAEMIGPQDGYAPPSLVKAWRPG